MTDALTRANASISVRGRRSAVACNRLRYAPCLTLQTLCVALLFILDLHYAEQPYSILCFSVFVLMTDALTRANASISVRGRRSAVACNRLRHSVQRAICHCERSVAISRKGHRLKNLRRSKLFIPLKTKTHRRRDVFFLLCGNNVYELALLISPSVQCTT